MFCNKCGNELIEGEKICNKCGNKIENKRTIILVCIGVILLLTYLLGIYIVTRNTSIKSIMNGTEMTKLIIIFLIGLSIALIPLFILIKEKITDSHKNRNNDKIKNDDENTSNIKSDMITKENKNNEYEYLEKLYKLKENGTITEREFEIEKYNFLNNNKEDTINKSKIPIKQIVIVISSIIIIGIIGIICGIISKNNQEKANAQRLEKINNERQNIAASIAIQNEEIMDIKFKENSSEVSQILYMHEYKHYNWGDIYPEYVYGRLSYSTKNAITSVYGPAYSTYIRYKITDGNGKVLEEQEGFKTVSEVYKKLKWVGYLNNYNYK